MAEISYEDFANPKPEKKNEIGYDEFSAPEGAIHPSIGYPAAALAGLAKDIPFSEDIAAGINAAKTYAGLHPTGVPTTGTFGERFRGAKDALRVAEQALSEQYPVTTIGSELGGAFALPMAGPANRIARSIEPFVGGSAARALGLGTVGAGYGALYGLGTGDTASERLHSAGIGGLAGGIGGAAIPPIASGVGRGAEWLLSKTGIGRPEAKASEQIVSAMSRPDRTAMTPQQVMEADIARQPTLPIDVGGQEVKALASTAANVSPEARGILESSLHERAKGQSSRLYDFAENLIGKRLDDPSVIDRIREQARGVNTPAYKAAMDKGAGGVWNPTLERLINHPWVKNAIPQAIEESNAAAIAEGKPAMRNPFVKDAEGNLTVPVDQEGNRTLPTLEFWDIIKKNLDGIIRSAEPTPTSRGDPNTVRIGMNIIKPLTKELDKAVPEYANARSGAGRYLGEEDAYRFGQKFLKSTTARDINQGIKNISEFTPEEREYAAHSYLSERMQKYLNKTTNRDISKITPADKQKDIAILGKQKADELEAYLLRESIMNNALSSLGNSKTVYYRNQALKFAADHGLGPLAGGAAGAVEGYREAGLDPYTIATRSAMGAVAGKFLQNSVRLGENTAVEIAKKLTSNDPREWREAITAIAENPEAMKALRLTHSGVAALAGHTSAELSSRQLEQARAERKSGGRVNVRDYPAKKATRLEREARRAHRDMSEELRPMMHMPDEAIAHALRLAK